MIRKLVCACGMQPVPAIHLNLHVVKHLFINANHNMQTLQNHNKKKKPYKHCLVPRTLLLYYEVDFIIVDVESRGLMVHG